MSRFFFDLKTRVAAEINEAQSFTGGAISPDWKPSPDCPPSLKYSDGSSRQRSDLVPGSNDVASTGSDEF
jgi:hypothetical protein